MDVQAIHLLGRSRASIADQMLFNESRQECMRLVSETQAGTMMLCDFFMEMASMKEEGT